MPGECDNFATPAAIRVTPPHSDGFSAPEDASYGARGNAMDLGGLAVLRILLAMLALALAAPAHAADLLPEGRYGAPSCQLASQSQLIYVEREDELREEVTLRFDQAVDVADSQSWIYSSRPVFIWASETKVACGKAIGYLDGGHVSEEYVGKCDCFYSRMVSFMR